MLDVDDFKGINDTQGHLCGDGVLESIGDTLRRTLRSSDVKSRYGGDEFLVILPETPAEGAEQVADHLRRAIERVEYAGRTRPFTLTVSVGVATALPNETDALALVGRADAALYRDKSNRRTLRLMPSAGLTAEAPATPARS
jgi:two-component system cell cycle response regulator